MLGSLTSGFTPCSRRQSGGMEGASGPEQRPLCIPGSVTLNTCVCVCVCVCIVATSLCILIPKRAIVRTEEMCIKCFEMLNKSCFRLLLFLLITLISQVGRPWATLHLCNSIVGGGRYSHLCLNTPGSGELATHCGILFQLGTASCESWIMPRWMVKCLH